MFNIHKVNILTFTSIIFLDQAIKAIIRKGLLVCPYINLVCNPGIAFGIKFNIYLIFFANFLIIILLIFFWISTNNSKTILALSLLAGSALSNLIDRILFGCVVDYLDLKIWPIFNLADLIISISVVYLIIFNLLGKQQK